MARRRADEGEIEVGILKLSIVGIDFVDEEWDVFLIAIGIDRIACDSLSVCSARRLVARGQTWNVERINQGRE